MIPSPAAGPRIAVVGAGSWGTAVARMLGAQHPEVRLWIYEQDLCETIRSTSENSVYLPGFPLPPSVHPFSDPAELGEMDILVWASPSHVARRVISSFLPHLTGREISVSLVKGIEEESLLTMSGILGQLLPDPGKERVVVLSGPSFAKEVAAGLPAAVVAAGRDAEASKTVQEAFSSSRFRVYRQSDPIGVELGGALKNVMAIAVGISDGMELGDNARAALITRGLAEIIRLGTTMGADQRTFAGLAGIGDLVLTCTGALSRNRSVGIRIGRGETLGEILSGMRMVAEGVKTSRAAMRLAARHGVEMPIITEVDRILHEGADPRRSVEGLMARPLTMEWR
jgi:glycerol-3-phosphate dehydrogenase (NAD(P)+)